MQPEKTYTLPEGRTLNIYHDADARLEDDSFAIHIFTWHPRYQIGKHIDRPDSGLEFIGAQVLAVQNAIKQDTPWNALDRAFTRLSNCKTEQQFRERQAAVARAMNTVCVIGPLYMYEHSGVAVSTKPFNDRWDSGQVGFVFYLKEDSFTTGELRRWTAKKQKAALATIEANVYMLDCYLRGDTWGYEVSDGESCWGFLGDGIIESGIFDCMTDEDQEHLITTKQVTLSEKEMRDWKKRRKAHA